MKLTSAHMLATCPTPLCSAPPRVALRTPALAPVLPAQALASVLALQRAGVPKVEGLQGLGVHSAAYMPPTRLGSSPGSPGSGFVAEGVLDGGREAALGVHGAVHLVAAPLVAVPLALANELDGHGLAGGHGQGMLGIPAVAQDPAQMDANGQHVSRLTPLCSVSD